MCEREVFYRVREREREGGAHWAKIKEIVQKIILWSRLVHCNIKSFFKRILSLT